MKLALDYAVVCDAVRREDNGKLIFIGVYGRHIGLRRFPADLSLSLAVRLFADEPGEMDLEFRCVPEGAPPSDIRKGHLVVAESGATLFAVPNLVIMELSPETTLNFQWRTVPNEDWETIASIPVTTSKRAKTE